jgi:Predicted membrane protein (DUF2232)
MFSKSTQKLDLKYLITFGAGLAAALLCLVGQQGTLPSIAVAYLAPLPIMIATLNFGQMTGLAATAVATGTITLYLAIRPPDNWGVGLASPLVFGCIFALTQGLPAWWLARLARLGRSDAAARWSDEDRSAGERLLTIYYPLSRILAYAALGSFAIVILTLGILVIDAGGYEAIIDRWAAKIAPSILEVIGTRELPAGADLQDLARFYIKLIPPVMTSTLLVLLVVNLWLGGRIVQLSNLLVRPWPDIAQELRLPRVFAPAFLVVFGLCILNGLPGTIAGCAAAALGMGFVLEGLAVVHALSRRMRFRAAALAAVYLTALFIPLMFVPLLIVGLLDAGFQFRDRKKNLASSQNLIR